MSAFGLVGPGNLGRTLALSLPAETWPLGPVMSHSKVSSRRAVREMRRGYAATLWEEFACVHVILVATPTDVLADALGEAAEQLPNPRGKRILITGIASPGAEQALARLRDRGASVGGLLPIAAYRRPSIIAPRSTFAGWGSRPARATARGIVKALRGKYVTIDARDDAQVALAIGAAAGLLTFGLELAVRRLVAAGFPRRHAIEALAALDQMCMQEHRKARLQAPAPWLPADYTDLMRAAGAAPPLEAALCAKALELASQDLR